jgi:hypothetical protein
MDNFSPLVDGDLDEEGVYILLNTFWIDITASQEGEFRVS